MDLGVEQDLALDVDGDGENVDVDMDALDSDGESETNEQLGIDSEESESEYDEIVSVVLIPTSLKISAPMHIVPLYALLPSDKQMRVFQPPPPGSTLR